MNMNYSDIKQELTDNWDQFAGNQYPWDLLNEFANSSVPIYYGEIIEDWQEMPNEFTDSWQEYADGEPFKRTIFDLMSIDLYNYYQSEYSRIYSELAKEMEATA